MCEHVSLWLDLKRYQSSIASRLTITRCGTCTHVTR